MSASEPGSVEASVEEGSIFPTLDRWKMTRDEKPGRQVDSRDLSRMPIFERGSALPPSAVSSVVPVRPWVLGEETGIPGREERAQISSSSVAPPPRPTRGGKEEGGASRNAQRCLSRGGRRPRKGQEGKGKRMEQRAAHRPVDGGCASEEGKVIEALLREGPEAIAGKIERLVERISQVIIGKEETIRLVVTSLCARGHLLLEDIPGVGKTTLARSLARSLDLSFQRIQFTPDLLPSDVFGISIYNPEEQEFNFKPGPIFSHVILADEINRATPRTQSALLEAMNEFQVTVDRHTYPLPDPFIVLATQNPVAFKGTYPLPESQLDRFLMKIHIGYPGIEDEKRIILGRSRRDPLEEIEPVLGVEEVLALQAAARQVRLEESLLDYLLAIVEATRRSEHLKTGVSPRGSLAFSRAVQAHALVAGRDFAIPDDVKALATPVLAHRLSPKVHWKEGWHAEDLVAEIVASVPVPL